MSEKKSFQEIVSNKLWGIWYCDGVVVECQSEFLEIRGLPKSKQDTFYIRDTTEKTFKKAKYMEFENAIKELTENKSVIISSIIPPIEQIKENTKAIGLNVFEPVEGGKIEMNKKKIFNSFNEILELDIISEEEKNDEWLVF